MVRACVTVRVRVRARDREWIFHSSSYLKALPCSVQCHLWQYNLSVTYANANFVTSYMVHNPLQQ